MDDGVDTLIIGAGVVGLACARAVAQRDRSVIVAERHPRSGVETSSRNSGVIHSGIYYPTGSLKARLCVEGRTLLYDYCHERGIAHRRCGKLIVAQAHQVTQLNMLHEKARANGVTDLRLLGAGEARDLEPAVRCEAALLSPSTGILDVHEYMLALEADIEAADGIIAFSTEFVSATARGEEIIAHLRTGGEVTRITCRCLINSGGLQAVHLLERIEGYPHDHQHRAYYAKGNYFACGGSPPFRHLVYPMPNEAGLGVHATLDMDGSTRFGPDVEWVEEINYHVDPARSAGFYESIREYWPALPAGALAPAFAGIRPKRVGPQQPAADFLIEGPDQHGVDGLVNLLGIESPGLTASLAIADVVARSVLAIPSR